MFTIKVFNKTGHYVIECKKYAFVRGVVEKGIALRTDSLQCGDDPGGADPFITLGGDTVYVMNSNGKTVDKFEPYPPDHPLRQAIDPSLRKPDYEERFKEAVEANNARFGSIGDLDPREQIPEGYSAPLDLRTTRELIGERVRKSGGHLPPSSDQP